MLKLKFKFKETSVKSCILLFYHRPYERSFNIFFCRCSNKVIKCSLKLLLSQIYHPSVTAYNKKLTYLNKRCFIQIVLDRSVPFAFQVKAFKVKYKMIYVDLSNYKWLRVELDAVRVGR